MASKKLLTYTDLDSIFDSSRGIAQKLITQHLSHLPLKERIKESDAYFHKHLLSKYKERTYHLFNAPELGITPEIFNTAYLHRSADDFDYYYPTPLLDGIFKIIVGIENSKNGGFDVEEINLTVNVHPYDFDEELLTELENQIKLKVGGYFKNIHIVNLDIEEKTASYFQGYDYVFKKDIMFGCKKFHQSLENVYIPNTQLIVPILHYKYNEGFKGTPKETLELFSVTMGTVIGITPIDKSLYDCYL